MHIMSSDKCIAECSKGTKAMARKVAGAVTQINKNCKKKKNPYSSSTCISYKNALCEDLGCLHNNLLLHTLDKMVITR